MSAGTSSEETTAAAGVASAVAGPLGGEPTALGLPCFIAGAVSFGPAQAGVVPAAAVGAALPVILGFSAVGIFLTTIWAASIGRNVVAGRHRHAHPGHASTAPYLHRRVLLR